MAVTLKRKRGAVSYKEPSSDEDTSLDSDREGDIPTQRESSQRRSRRHQPAKAEPSTNGRRQNATRADESTTNRTQLSRSRRKTRVSYREASSADDSDDDFDQASSAEEATTTRRTLRSKGNTSRRVQKIRTAKSRPKRAFGAALQPQSDLQQALEVPQHIVTDGNIPEWASLPYHILLQIFVYASHPLHNEYMGPTGSIPWLVQMAQLCSAFTKPALTALYRNPPIFALKQTRKDLVRHLISPPSDSHENYSVMVKRLKLDGTHMSSLTDPTHSAADLVALISSLTTLKEIDIFDPMDRPPYRERQKRMRWHYPDEVFNALRQSDLRLRSWHWTSTFCTQGPLWLKDMHTNKFFQSLRELTLTKFCADTSRKAEDMQPTTEELLASALGVLPHLDSLVFETCTVVNEQLMPMLPKNLVSLNITNCIDITSEALRPFLVTHGTRLEELILNHNQCLDLSFLVDLKQSCPRLEVLSMDMTYYSTLSESADNEPLYDHVLEEGDVPTWPCALRVIDLDYLRKWTAASATTFFNSLIDSAEELPWLRELRISAMVDVDWRQRAEFRKKWTARFQNVFAQKMTIPDPHLMSLRAFREYKTLQGGDTEKNDSVLEDVLAKANKVNTAESESDEPLLPSRKQKQGDKWTSRRLRSRVDTVPNYDETSGSESEEEAVEDNTFVQGRCHTVVFRIDNSRPREEMYGEEHFLDAERSGDEDWDGNDVVDDEYAW
ncbi:hypothetical protein BDV95DRAFT_478540 [Massariosphaeria phaeospora]|uniref:Uncharacterized protein n=1 Tax=Massariosphaeria phaeospora TaxID=100035 RepID=A0A7C8MYW4_9PLEO|nr:hypothetical protein BDV95DRAFT_478540 [Massariosphaeria phaeospora]